MKKIEKSWQNNGERESKGEKTERDVRLYLNFLWELSLWLFIYIQTGQFTQNRSFLFVHSETS